MPPPPCSRLQGPRSARPRGRCWIRRTRERRTQGSSAWEGRGACGPGRGPRKPGGPGPAPRSFLGPQHAARARRSPAGLRRASAQCRLLAEASVCPEPPRADPRLRVRAGGSLSEAFGSARASQLPKRDPGGRGEAGPCPQPGSRRRRSLCRLGPKPPTRGLVRAGESAPNHSPGRAGRPSVGLPRAAAGVRPTRPWGAARCVPHGDVQRRRGAAPQALGAGSTGPGAATPPPPAPRS